VFFFFFLILSHLITKNFLYVFVGIELFSYSSESNGEISKHWPTVASQY